MSMEFTCLQTSMENYVRDNMRRTKEDAEKTRKAILASAMDIFCEKGYSKTTFDEIAKRINLT